MRNVALTAILFASTLLLLPLGCGGNGSGPDNTTAGDAGAGGSGSTGGTQGGGGSSGQAGNTGGGGDQSGTTGRGGSASGEAGRGGATIAGSGGGGTTVAGAGGDGNGGAAGTGNGGAAVAGSGGSGGGGSGSGGRGGAAGGGAGAGGKGGGAAGGAAGTDTWANYAQGFFQTYCVSCHNDDNSGTATRDYHMLANVMSEKAKIACGVSKSQADWTKRGCANSPAARQFPAGTGAKPSDAERDRLILWIDANTP